MMDSILSTDNILVVLKFSVMEKEILTQKLIIHLVDRFMKASIEKDTIFMESYLHPKFLFATPRGTLFNHDTFFSDFLLNTKFTLVEFERIQQNVIVAPGLVLMNGVVKAKFQDLEEQFERSSFLWISGSKDWSLLQIHSTFTNKPLITCSR